MQAADRWKLDIVVHGAEFSFKAMLAIQLHQSTQIPCRRCYPRKRISSAPILLLHPCRYIRLDRRRRRPLVLLNLSQHLLKRLRIIPPLHRCRRLSARPLSLWVYHLGGFALIFQIHIEQAAHICWLSSASHLLLHVLLSIDNSITKTNY